MSEPQMIFNGIWPTYLIRCSLTNFSKYSDDLVRHIMTLEANQYDLTARFTEQTFFCVDSQAVCWLKNEVSKIVVAYMEDSGVESLPAWTLQGWYNVNRRGDHHAPHTHPRAYLSGTVYIQIPQQYETNNDLDTQHGCISFYDPRSAANMVTLGCGFDSKTSFMVRPEPGMLLLWPSPLQHYVHPHMFETVRISVSFNCIVNP